MPGRATRCRSYKIAPGRASIRCSSGLVATGAVVGRNVPVRDGMDDARGTCTRVDTFDHHARFTGVNRSYIDMRVAIFVVTLLAGTLSPAGFSQALDAADAPAFRSAVPLFSAVPVAALSSPGLAVQQLAAPAVKPTAARSTPASRRAGSHSARLLESRASAHRLPAPAERGGGQAGIEGSGAAARPLGSGSMMNSAASLRSAAAHPIRSIGDHLLTGVVGLMLIAYQLRRTHRVLRPHPFTT